MKSFLLVTLGILFLALGAVGVLIPVLPTTPFVLLAAGCLCTGNPTIYNRLAASPFFGQYITNYRTQAGVERKVKIQSIAFLWAGLALSFFLSSQWHLRLFLLFVGVAVTIHIYLLKTKS